jgi:two-component sensor histidine kinase
MRTIYYSSSQRELIPSQGDPLWLSVHWIRTFYQSLFAFLVIEEEGNQSSTDPMQAWIETLLVLLNALDFSSVLWITDQDPHWRELPPSPDGLLIRCLGITQYETTTIGILDIHSNPQYGSESLRYLGEWIHQDVVQKRTLETIQSTLKQKDALLKEMHHRMTNHLQFILSLLRLHEETFTAKKIVQIFQEARSRITAISLVHEQLYCSSGADQIVLSDYLRHLLELLFRVALTSVPAVQMEVIGDPIEVSLEIAVYCGLIVNELVTNALKYAFQGAVQDPWIYIRLKENEAELVLEVEDNGIEASPERQIRQSRSFGLELVRTLVEHLEGTLKTDRIQGTRVTFIFPRASLEKKFLRPEGQYPPG